MNNNRETNEGQTEAKVKFKIPDAQTLITIFYISIVMVGMFFNNSYYGNFDINIFEYSDILDFLVAPIGDIKILLFALVTLLILYLLFRFDAWVFKNKPESYTTMWMGLNKKPWFNKFYNLQYLFFIPIYLYGASIFYGTYQGKKILKSEDKMEIVFIDGTNTSGKKIGANSNFHFILEGEEEIKIIPNSSIKSIVSKLKMRKDKDKSKKNDKKDKK